MSKLYIFGHEIFAEQLNRPENGKWTVFRYRDTNERVQYRTDVAGPNVGPDRPCPKCGKCQTPEGHDPCIANLPGVINACCGHGKDLGYIAYENGDHVVGSFEVIQEWARKQNAGVA